MIGGFHLSGRAFEPIIGPTCDALGEFAPDYLVPTHCTGWRATHALAARFPDAFIPNSVGTSFEFAAAPATADPRRVGPRDGARPPRGLFQACVATSSRSETPRRGRMSSSARSASPIVAWPLTTVGKIWAVEAKAMPG